MANNTKNILLLGFGYCAQALTHHLTATDYIVTVTSRDRNKVKQWQGRPVQWITQKQELIDAIKNSHYILLSAPPSDQGDPFYSDIKNTLVAHRHRQWIGYLSATSVYGDHGGDWVSETSQCRPTTSRAQRRLMAEQQWLELYQEHQLPIHIFRLAGIYGPDRNALVKLNRGDNKVIVKQGQVFSRVHVTDIALALLTSWDQPTPGEIYNLADDEPCNNTEVMEYAAELLDIQLEYIPYAQAKLTPMQQSFYINNRRVSNRKIKEMLRFKFRYPNYQAGLNHLLQQFKS